jgi:putative integral membrane protein (TIGR02587 family)
MLARRDRKCSAHVLLRDRSMSTREQSRSQWAEELDDLVRGASGGFLFSTPLLYTMEVWWIGTFINPGRMLVALGLAFGVVLLLNHTTGFRKAQPGRLSEVAIETTEALALSLVLTAGVLLLLRRITLETPLEEALGKVIYESVPFALGVSLGNQFLSGGRQERQGDEQQQSGEQQGSTGELNATLKDLGATAVGATFIALSIAPTDEVPMLAAAITPPWLLALMAASLLISYGIVFEAGFANQKKREQHQGVLQRPLSETVAAYLVSLAASALMLWFFHQLSFDDPWQIWLSHTLVLGLPAAVGGAAGRLAV